MVVSPAQDRLPPYLDRAEEVTLAALTPKVPRPVVARHQALPDFRDARVFGRRSRLRRLLDLLRLLELLRAALGEECAESRIHRRLLLGLHLLRPYALGLLRVPPHSLFLRALLRREFASFAILSGCASVREVQTKGRVHHLFLLRALLRIFAVLLVLWIFRELLLVLPREARTLAPFLPLTPAVVVVPAFTGVPAAASAPRALLPRALLPRPLLPRAAPLPRPGLAVGVRTATFLATSCVLAPLRPVVLVSPRCGVVGSLHRNRKSHSRALAARSTPRAVWSALRRRGRRLRLIDTSRLGFATSPNSSSGIAALRKTTARVGRSGDGEQGGRRGRCDPFLSGPPRSTLDLVRNGLAPRRTQLAPFAPVILDVRGVVLFGRETPEKTVFGLSVRETPEKTKGIFRDHAQQTRFNFSYLVEVLTQG